MKLDKNLRKKMLGLLPFDENSIEKYTPKEFSNKDIPEDFKPIFHLKPWNQEQKDNAVLIAQKMIDGDDSKKIELNKQLNDSVRFNVIDIERLYDLGKNEFIKVEKEEGCISISTWKSIPKTTQSSIYYCLSSISGLTTGETMGL